MKKYPMIFGQNFGIPAIVHQQGCITAFFLELVRSAVISEKCRNTPLLVHYGWNPKILSKYHWILFHSKYVKYDSLH
jgi:hypothetical protein